MIHDPEKILFSWSQDEEEGAYYQTSTTDIWSQNINNIACANFNNQSKVVLNGIWPESKGVFTYGDIGEIRLEIPEIAASKNDNLIDLNSLKITDGSIYSEVVYKSVSGKYRVFFDVPIEKKSEFLKVLNSPDKSYFENLIKKIPKEESQEAYSMLSQLSECSYRLISTADRIKYLGWLTGEINMNDDQETILINLLKYNDDISGFYKFLCEEPIITAKLVTKCDGNNKQVVLNELVKLCNEAWTDKTPKGVIYTGKTTVTIGGNEHEADYITCAEHVEGSNNYDVQNYAGIFSSGVFDIGQVQEYPPIVKLNCNLLDPLCVYIDNKPYVLPMIYPAQLSEQLGNSEMFNQLIGSVAQVALMYGGAKLVSALAPEGKMIIEYLRITPKSFATLFLTDVGLQVTTNYLIDQNWANALGQVDLFDAAFSGAIGNIASIPIKGSQLLNMAKFGKQFSICRQITTNTTKVVTIEFTKIAFDYKLADNDFKTLCDNNEDYYDVMTKLILSLAAHYTAEEIHGFLKGWNNKVVESIEVEFDQIARPVLLKVNEIVQTENFGKIIGAGTGVIAKFIEQINQEAPEVEYKIIEIENIDKSINEIVNIKQDNTNVILPLTE